MQGIQLAALFLDAVFLPVRLNGPKEGVLVASIHRAPHFPDDASWLPLGTKISSPSDHSARY